MNWNLLPNRSFLFNAVDQTHSGSTNLFELNFCTWMILRIRGSQKCMGEELFTVLKYVSGESVNKETIICSVMPVFTVNPLWQQDLQVHYVQRLLKLKLRVLLNFSGEGLMQN